MNELFQNVLTASFHGSIVIVAVLLLRLVLKKTPKKFLCLLWLLAGIRLLMPFEIRSDLSLQPDVEEIPYVAEVREELPQTVPETRPQLSDYPVLPASPDAFAAPEFIPEGYYEAVLGVEEPEEVTKAATVTESFDWMELLTWVWFAVACCFGVYTLFAYITLRVQVRDAIKIPGGWESDRIETAFVLGFIRPKIYIPMGMPGSVRKHILAHERTHLEKGDHWFKMIGFIALAIHWFNPLVWVAYILLCKDIELACDERVVQFMELEERKRYSAALLTCSANKAHFAACPVAFGEVSVKERIKSVLNYKKPSFWISLLGVIAILFVAVCLVTSPAKEETVPVEETTEETVPVNVVNVKNPDELLAAIAPDTEIILNTGTYILSEASDYGKETESEYYTWTEVYDGYQLTLTGVENLTIRGSGLHVTIVETDPRYANVIAMENCSNVKLEDITAGHTRNRGECGGGVLYLSTSSDITMNRLGLYGCGVIGLETDGCTDITLTDSDIYECSNSAAFLVSSHDVTISGCRIYDIGNEQYGGYTFFQVSNCSGVLIENNELSDSTLNCLMATGGSAVELKNNLFTNNRPQSGAFSGDDQSITMDGNRFEGNTIRSWYSFGAACKDKNGKTLTEEDLNEQYGTEPTEPAEPQLEIHVSTVDELIAAIGPDKDIVLDAALYDLSTATGYGTSSGDYYYWEDIFDGPGLIIQNVSNMTIRTATGNVDNHTIAAIPRYADVLNFKACSNITLSGFTAGHTKEQGSCAGGVLEFADCDQITVDNCGLFGCGILGVQTDNCAGVTVKNCDIYECSQGGILLRNTQDVTITDTTFRDIGGNYIMHFSACKNVTVDGEVLIGEAGGSEEIKTEEQEAVWSLYATYYDFAYYYLSNDKEQMTALLASTYSGDGETYSDGENWANFQANLEITMEHVNEIERAGSMVFTVPFQETREGYQSEEVQQLTYEIIREGDAYKVLRYSLEE